MHTTRLHEDGTLKEIIVTVTGRGQVTVPAEVRRHFGARTGDKLAFVINDEGEVQLTLPHYPDVASIRGAAGSLEKPLSWKEMREIAREEHAEAVRRERA